MLSNWLPDIEWEVVFIALSAVVALLIWYEGQVLKKTEGKMPASSLFHFSSLLDTAWFFIAMIALYYLDFHSTAIAVPVAYGIYSIFGWIYGMRLMGKAGLPDNPEDLVIPLPYVSYSQSFAVMFFLLCMTVLFFPSFSISLPFNLPF